MGHQHLDRGPKRRIGKRVCVAPEKQRAVDPLAPAVPRDRLAHHDDVILREGPRQRASTVTGGPERHRLPGVRRIRALVVVGRDQPIDVDQQIAVGWPASRGHRGEVSRDSAPKRVWVSNETR